MEVGPFGESAVPLGGRLEFGPGGEEGLHFVPPGFGEERVGLDREDLLRRQVQGGDAAVPGGGQDGREIQDPHQDRLLEIVSLPDVPVNAPQGGQKAVVGLRIGHGGEEREDEGKQVRLLQEGEDRRGGAAADDLEEFLQEAGRGGVPDFPLVPEDGQKKLGLDAELETGGKGQGPEHAHRVLQNPAFGVPDHADHPGPEVLQPAHVVVDREIGDIVVEAVDGEIAAEGILLRASEGVVEPDARLLFIHSDGGRRGRAAEGGHLDDLVGEEDVDKAEPAADDA